jgi:hypothetical protein
MMGGRRTDSDRFRSHAGTTPSPDRTAAPSRTTSTRAPIPECA